MRPSSLSRQRLRLRLVPLAAFLVAVTACSTVTRPVESLGQSGPPTAGPSASSQGTTGVAPGTTGGSTSGATTGTSTGGAATGGLPATTGSTGAATGASSTTGPAAFRCDKTLTIGVSYSSDFGAAAAAVTDGSQADGSNYADTLKKLYAIGISDLNKRGGLGGCTVALALHDFRVAGADGFDGQSQQECADFVDDKKVFAIYPAWFESKVLVSCASRRGIPVLPGPAITFFPTKADFARFRGVLYGPAMLAVDRLGPAMDLLQQNGYFDKGAKVGFLVDDDADGTNRRLVEKIWKPRLAALGVTVAATFVYEHPSSATATADTSSAMASAVVQFRRAGVTHVIPTPDSGGGVQLFTPVADSQGYHPRLGVMSTSGAEMLAVTNGPVPAASKVGAVAVSWTLFDFAGDTSNNGWTRNPSNPSRDHCVALYRKEAAANRVALPSLFPWCDSLNLLREALAASTSVPTTAALLRGVDGLGRSFPSVTGYGPVRLGPGHYDGADAVRVMSWNSGAGRWDYRTAPKALP